MKTPVVDAVVEQTPIPTHSVAWHTLPAEQVTNLLEVNAHVGLEVAEVQARLDRAGFNRLPEAARRPAWFRFLLQFHNILIYELLGSAAITAILFAGKPAPAGDRARLSNF